MTELEKLAIQATKDHAAYLIVVAEFEAHLSTYQHLDEKSVFTLLQERTGEAYNVAAKSGQALRDYVKKNYLDKEQVNV